MLHPWCLRKKTKLRIISILFSLLNRLLVCFGLYCFVFVWLFLFALLRCHFEEVEREHHEPPADRLWSQAAGQPQSPSEAPVTGLPSHWKPRKTCTEYCNPLTMCSVSPKRNRKESNPTFRMERLKKSQGIPRPAWGGGGLKWGGNELATWKESSGIWFGGGQIFFYEC